MLTSNIILKCHLKVISGQIKRVKIGRFYPKSHVIDESKHVNIYETNRLIEANLLIKRFRSLSKIIFIQSKYLKITQTHIQN